MHLGQAMDLIRGVFSQLTKYTMYVLQDNVETSPLKVLLGGNQCVLACPPAPSTFISKWALAQNLALTLPACDL